MLLSFIKLIFLAFIVVASLFLNSILACFGSGCRVFLYTLHPTVHSFVRSFIRNSFLIQQCRGDTFRGLLNRVGELCSLFPVGVNIMALTATATKQVRMRVCRILGMAHPFIVALSPCKHNIMYSVGICDWL